MALILPPFHAPLRAIGALAMDEAKIAIGTFGVVFLHAKQGEPGENTEKRAERAKNTTPKPRDHAVHKEHGDEQDADEPGMMKIKLL